MSWCAVRSLTTHGFDFNTLDMFSPPFYIVVSAVMTRIMMARQVSASVREEISMHIFSYNVLYALRKSR